MKYTSLFIFAFNIILLVACTPKNEEVTDEHIQIAPPAEALDSITDTDKDGLRTDENEINPTLPLPQPVLQLLTQKYPGWEQPILTESAKQNAQDLEQGPFIVRGEFNGNTSQDYALQLQQGKDLIVVSVINEDDGSWTVHEIAKDILFNDRGKLKSMYYLHLAEKGNTVVNNENNEIELTNDAIVVGIENDIKVHAMQNGTFKAYHPKD